MSPRALSRKWQGVVVDARFRDLEEQLAFNFPVSEPLLEGFHSH